MFSRKKRKEKTLGLDAEKERAHCYRGEIYFVANWGCHQERSMETDREFLFRTSLFDEEAEWE